MNTAPAADRRRENPPALTFFFPYHEVSGVPMLFSRMAVYLAGRGVDVRVVDYVDGPMAGRIRDIAEVRLLPFRDGEPISIGDDSVLVMQSILPATMRPELRIAPSTRMLFWTLHPVNLVQTIIPLPLFRDLQMRSRIFNDAVMNTVLRGFAARLRAFFRELVRRRGIIFMDGENLRITCERLNVTVPEPVLVPVSSDSVETNCALGVARTLEKGLSLGWLGRLADFKIHILAHTLRRFSRIALDRRFPIRFWVIGDGPDAGRIRRAELEHDYFHLEMVGSVRGAALDDLLQQVDVLAAMGTSALEGARLGIPTILLDISYGPIRGDYVFRWLHETTRYTLGEVVGSRHYRAGNKSLEDMIDAVVDDYDSLSGRAFDYYRANHAIDVVAERFLSAVRETRFTFADIDRDILEKGLTRRMYEWIRSRAKRGNAASRQEARA